MKNDKRLKSFFLAMVMLLSAGQVLLAQDKKQENVVEMIKNQQYVFKAQSMFPAPARLQQLNYDYDVKISKDTLQSYLPYFGRAFTAPIDQTRGALDFTSTEFEYQVEDRKKGGWNITVKPKDNRDIQQYYFTIQENGSATLRVLSNNRQPISFNGYITRKD
jgi:hypothetical protein